MPNGHSQNHRRELNMRSAINLDDNLIERAKHLTGTKETAAVRPLASGINAYHEYE